MLFFSSRLTASSRETFVQAMLLLCKGKRINRFAYLWRQIDFTLLSQLLQGQERNCNFKTKKQHLCDMKKSPCVSVSVFNPVNRMHRSSSGSYWTICTQKSTADPTFDEQGRSPNKNMPDLGARVHVEKILSLKIWCPSCDHILFSLISPPPLGFRKRQLPCGRSTWREMTAE